MRKLVLRTLVGGSLLCFVCLPALAQTTGTIRGQIKDQDGKLYNLQVTAGRPSTQFALEQYGQTVIAVPASDDTTFPDQNVLDLSLGRSFGAGPTEIRIDLQLFNVFNNDAHDSWQTLILRPGDDYYPSAYVLPRRLGVRLGVHF